LPSKKLNIVFFVFFYKFKFLKISFLAIFFCKKSLHLIIFLLYYFRDKITSAFCAIFQVAMATEGDYYEPLDRYSIPRR